MPCPTLPASHGRPHCGFGSGGRRALASPDTAAAAAQAATSPASNQRPMRWHPKSELRRHRQPHAGGSKLAAAPARRRRVPLPARTHHDRLALLDLVAGGLEPGHNLALCGGTSINKLVGQAAFASGPGIAHIVIWAPANAVGSGAQVKAGGRPAWAPARGLPVIVLDSAGMKTSLTAFCTTRWRREPRTGPWRADRPRCTVLAARDAMVQSASRSGRPTGARWLAGGRFRAWHRAQRMSPMQPLGWRIPLAHAITQPCRSSQTAGRAAEGPASPGGSGRAVPSAGLRPCAF